MHDSLDANGRAKIESAPHIAGPTNLNLVDILEIAVTHPIRRLNDCYSLLRQQCEDQQLPHLHDLLEAVDDGLMEYCLILLPVPGIPFVDFQVLHRGRTIPGSDMASFKFGERYTDHILPVFANDRILELTACLSLKTCRFSRALSARRSSLSVVVLRGVLPVWLPEYQLHAVVLAVAPEIGFANS